MQAYLFGPYTVYYVARSEWDLIGRERGEYTGPQDYHALVPHHTVTGFIQAYYEMVIEKMRQLQNLRPDLGQDIPYNFVNFADPNDFTCWIAEGRGIGWSGAHTSGYNYEVHACAFWGNSVTDPVSPGVLEGFRFVGRLMQQAGCPVNSPTLDHGSYPNQGTACAGTKIRAALPELQPPFGTPSLAPIHPDHPKEHEVYEFDLRLNSSGHPDVFDWPGIGPAIAYDQAVCDVGDEITVNLKRNSTLRNIILLESNGAQTVKTVSWGAPTSFVLQNGGWTSILAGADAINLLKVQGRG